MNKREYVKLAIEAIKQSKEDGNVQVQVCGNCGFIMQLRHKEGEKCAVIDHYE